MFRIKKLDIFIIKSFVFLLIGTFFICLFIFMMQFLWMHVDDMVGKGLSIGTLIQFFYYSALSLVPVSLPLAILLASLITFGNFGERFELLSMKAAGIPLMRIMRPLIIFIGCVCGMSFYFQNVTVPESQTKLWTLLFSMKQKSPELDIPEGAFYRISDYNIYVKKKDPDTGMLYGVMIYNFSDGFENAHIIQADSGRMEVTADKEHLQLHLYNGEQFENLRQQTAQSRNVPYRRESFSEKHSLIEFDSNFNMMDESFMSSQSQSKNMNELKHSIDSMSTRFDSIGRSYYTDAKTRINVVASLNHHDSLLLEKSAEKTLNMDSIFRMKSKADQKRLLQSATTRVNNMKSDFTFRGSMMKDSDRSLRRHQLEWNNKIALSLACMIFLFIGVPLGAIIRKGGLGMPVIVSVVIFLIYYIVDTMGKKMARDGTWEIWFGAWISTFVLVPMGVFFTYKSNNDSVVFNIDAYKALFTRLLGLRTKRHYTKKEVIINDPDYDMVAEQLRQLSDTCQAYANERQLGKAPNYFRLFFHCRPDNTVAEISTQLEAIIEDLSNSRNNRIILALNDYPIIFIAAHKNPFSTPWMSIVAGTLFPVGLVLYFRVWRFSLRLNKDLKQIVETNRAIETYIEQIKNENNKD